MFDYSLANWVTFLTAAILLNISPGPDMAFILGQTAKGGVKSGFLAIFGIWMGAFVHIIFAALGLSAILTTSAVAFSIVKWMGVAYLIWLGIQAIKSKGISISIKDRNSNKRSMKIFKQGVLVTVLNPKVAIFFLAFLPQFVEAGAGPVSMQLFLHGSLIIVIAGFVELPLILIGGKLVGYLNNNVQISRWLDRSLGTLFIGLGIELAISDR